ncbi:MAG: hypothetical protein O2971_07165 [Proteobacteria bacterium]|nr:hypothetical protein [Pseudomonadota bacterium]
MDSEHPEITPEQISLAEKFAIAVEAKVSADQLLELIEQKLGQNTTLELARWFLMSVLRHSNRADWVTLADSQLAEKEQYALVASFIDRDDLKQSLHTVLKDNRCRFTLIRFAKARNIEKRVLSSTTKAFKQAQVLLREAGLLEGSEKKTASRKPVSNAVHGEARGSSASVSHRRAARRGYFDDDPVDYTEELNIGAAEPSKDKLENLSDQEYAELQKLIVGEGERVPQQNWNYPTNEDRLSLLFGLAGGCVVFALVLWLVL